MNKFFICFLFIAISGAILYFIFDNFYNIFWSLLANILGIFFSVIALVTGVNFYTQSENSFGCIGAIVICILIIGLGLFIMGSIIPEPIMDTVFG